LQSSIFELSYANNSIWFDQETKGFGEFYPYRDLCNKKGDPECLSSPVLYFKAYFLPMDDNATLRVIEQGNGHAFFTDTLLFSRELRLHKKDISCSGGNEYNLFIHLNFSAVCAKECEKRHGEWNTIDNLCIINIYLNSICIRITRKNETHFWSIDTTQ
jgi:hypothetical protein